MNKLYSDPVHFTLQLYLNSSLASLIQYFTLTHRIQFSDQHNGPQLHRKGPRKFPKVFSAQIENLCTIRQGGADPSLPWRAGTGKNLFEPSDLIR